MKSLVDGKTELSELQAKLSTILIEKYLKYPPYLYCRNVAQEMYDENHEVGVYICTEKGGPDQPGKMYYGFVAVCGDKVLELYHSSKGIQLVYGNGYQHFGFDANPIAKMESIENLVVHCKIQSTKKFLRLKRERWIVKSFNLKG